MPAFDGSEQGLLPVAVLAFRQSCRSCSRSIVHAPNFVATYELLLHHESKKSRIS